MNVIRIEHECGKGLFRANNRNPNSPEYTYNYIDNLSCHDDLMTKHFLFPTPSKEGYEMSHYEYCAFKSIEQIQQWIDNDWWNEIINAGFKVYSLILVDAVELEYQVIFKKYNIVTKTDITDLFKTK